MLSSPSVAPSRHRYLRTDEDEDQLWKDVTTTMKLSVLRQETESKRRESVRKSSFRGKHKAGSIGFGGQGSAGPAPAAPKRPTTAPSKGSITSLHESGKGLRRISFVAAKDPQHLSGYPFSEFPQHGRFTPTGGFYVDENLEYEFNVRPSFASAIDEDIFLSSAEELYNNFKPRESGSDVDAEGGFSPEKADLAQCNVDLFLPLSEKESNPASYRSTLRAYSQQLPEVGTKLVVEMRRLWFNHQLSDITMTFPVSQIKLSKAFTNTVYAMIRTSALTDSAKRRGKWVVCPANPELEDYLYAYCRRRLAEDNPCDAVHAAVFIAHRNLYDVDLREGQPQAVSSLLRLSATEKPADEGDATAFSPFGAKVGNSRVERMLAESSSDDDGDETTASPKQTQKRNAPGFFQLTMSLLRKGKEAVARHAERAGSVSN
jgi:hypothetical protein